MPKFVVHRDLPGITPEALAGAGLRAKTCCAEMTAEGQEATWLRSFYLPHSEQTHCDFEGPSCDAITEVNQRAQIPFTEIVEVHELTPQAI